MKTGDIVAGMVLLILIYLIVVNYKGTTEVIKASGGGLTDVIGALQGR